jgi:hypothetical protein
MYLNRYGKRAIKPEKRGCGQGSGSSGVNDLITGQGK